MSLNMMSQLRTSMLRPLVEGSCGWARAGRWLLLAADPVDSVSSLTVLIVSTVFVGDFISHSYVGSVEMSLLLECQRDMT